MVVIEQELADRNGNPINDPDMARMAKNMEGVKEDFPQGEQEEQGDQAATYENFSFDHLYFNRSSLI